MLSFLLGALALYGVVVLIAWLAQDRLLYFPQRVDRPTLEAEARARGLSLWPAGEADYLALAPAPMPVEARATLVVFHGNAGSAIDRDYYVQALAPRGIRVLLAEYPGYGGRNGRPRERTLIEAGIELVARVRSAFREPLVLWGESMGAAIAAGVACRLQAPEPDPPSSSSLRGLILLTPWRSLPELAQALYPWLPARWLTRDAFDLPSSLRSFERPIAVLMAGRDEIIPNAHTRRLFEEISAPKRLWTFEGANHNSWPAAAHHEWWDEVLDFALESPETARDRSGS